MDLPELWVAKESLYRINTSSLLFDHASDTLTDDEQLESADCCIAILSSTDRCANMVELLQQINCRDPWINCLEPLIYLIGIHVYCWSLYCVVFVTCLEIQTSKLEIFWSGRQQCLWSYCSAMSVVAPSLTLWDQLKNGFQWHMIRERTVWIWECTSSFLEVNTCTCTVPLCLLDIWCMSTPYYLYILRSVDMRSVYMWHWHTYRTGHKMYVWCWHTCNFYSKITESSKYTYCLQNIKAYQYIKWDSQSLECRQFTQLHVPYSPAIMRT